MVVSEIRSLYRDADDLFRTVLKRIYEEPVGDRWVVRRVEIIFEDGAPAQPLEYRHGWIIPPEWEFMSEVYEYERKPVSEIAYEHEGEVPVIRE